ncbi:hypothetical protein [Photobacterium atrarenae]|uniref:Uncharacterized protein n=1 Tax=Photobacterium atrarenae TaxID=865757 RepID=A0ABY5GKN9_9GAMM|nr:hypothetical protein [Photobacterium atrarenae]UTV29478.1 hypothetical protein NNL38_20890 [Photobacterium atrarenae]
MSRSKFAYKKLALTVMLASGVLAGCSDSDGISKKTDPTPTPPPAAKTIVNPVSLIFQSIDTGVLTDQEITFTLRGEQVQYLFVQGADENTDKAEANSKSYTAKSGTVQISRVDGASVNEFTLELHATSPGFFATGKNILIPAQSAGVAGKEGASYDVFFTPLVPSNDEAPIAAAQETISSDNGGAVDREITIATPPPADPDSDQAKAMANTKVEMKIPVGTQLLDAAGDPVTGTVTANIVHFSNEPNGNASNESVLDAFPGGLEPDIILDANGDEDPALAGGGFISAGFTAIQLQNEQGDTVAQFDQPITLTFDVPADTINPETKAKIKTGETIPVWSYDETTGRWKAEGEGTVGDLNAETNTFTLTKNITHLSYYNLDYFWGSRCYADIKLEEVNGNDYNPRVIFTRAGGGWSKSQYIWGMGKHTFARIPADGAGKLQVVSRSNYRDGLIKSVTHKNGTAIAVANDGSITHNFCDLDGSTIKIESPETRTLNVSLESKCLDTGETKVQPGVVEVYSQNMRRYFGTVTPAIDSAASIRLVRAAYKLKGTIYTEKFGNQQVDQNVVVNKDTSVTLTFPIDKCGTTTGTTGTTGASGGSGG